VCVADAARQRKASARCVVVVVWMAVEFAADYNGQTSNVLGEFWPDAEERQCAADLSARIGLGGFGGLEIPCGPARRRGRLDTNPA
jgi:hypothetical protein